ncbi:MAG: hypothetical protein ACI9UN_003255 [Granulosicoccus sp.]|jgi:hypothetical protein
MVQLSKKADSQLGNRLHIIIPVISVHVRICNTTHEISTE